jgi:hypothetical protein
MKEKWIKTEVDIEVIGSDETTYETVNFYWLVKEFNHSYEDSEGNIIEQGWGNGYVLIPNDHPFADKEQWSEYGDEISGIKTYSTGDIFQEITASGPLSTKSLAMKKYGFTKDMKSYFLLGFDTAHGHNSKADDFTSVVYDTISLVNHLKDIYRDYYTIKRASLPLLNERMKEEMNAVVKRYLGNKSSLAW